VVAVYRSTQIRWKAAISSSETRGAMLVAVYVRRDDAQIGLLEPDRYVSHFATCPDAPIL
jgi:hypothetical protein